MMAAHEEEEDVIITEHHRQFTGAEFLCHALVSAGVTHVFGGHGGAIVPLVDAIVRHPALTWVYCRCETNASMCASAYAKLHGILGCCVATSGPGASHLLSGLIDSDQDRVPLLCITGMKCLGKTRHSDFQDIDQTGIFRMAGLAMSETVSHVDQLLPLSRNAFTAALASNRCAHLAIPIDVQMGTMSARTHFCLGTAFQSRICVPASTVQVEAFAAALRRELMCGRRVLIACGYRANAMGRLIERLAELMRSPILTSFDGKGTVDEGHPLSYGVVGVYGNAGTEGAIGLLERCDTVVGVCVNEYTGLVADAHGLQVREFLQIDERLVAGDSMRFNPGAVLSCGYLGDTLDLLIRVLEGHVLRSGARGGGATPPSESAANVPEETVCNVGVGVGVDAHEPGSADDVWSQLMKGSYVKATGTPSTFLSGTEFSTSPCIRSEEHCHPGVLFKVMGEILDGDAVVCADIGDNSLWLASALPAKRGQRFLTSEHLGIMGYAINSGLAASVSAAGMATNHFPGKKRTRDGGKTRQTLIVAGDGGIQMSINELATMRDKNVRNVLVVVVCNNRLGRVQNEVWGPGLDADGCHIGSPSYVDLFKAYGYPNGMILSTCDEKVISETIKKCWESAELNGCCVIEVRQDPEVHPTMFKLSLPDSLSRAPLRTEDSHHVLPNLEVDHWKSERPKIDEWLSCLNKVEKSDAYWLNKGDIFLFSPSEVAQTLLESLSIAPAGQAQPQLFKTAKSGEIFDTQFRASILTSMTPKTLLEEVVSKGMSNGHPLKLQLLACPPRFNFALHSHASAELIIPLVGDLWEIYLYGAAVNPSVLSRKLRLAVVEEGSALYKPPSDSEIEEVAQSLVKAVAEKIPSLGTTGKFVDRVNKEGSVLFNEIGSIHQTYTKDHGCLILVMWCGAHADIDQMKCTCTGIEGSKGLFLP